LADFGQVLVHGVDADFGIVAGASTPVRSFCQNYARLRAIEPADGPCTRGKDETAGHPGPRQTCHSKNESGAKDEPARHRRVGKSRFAVSRWISDTRGLCQIRLTPRMRLTDISFGQHNANRTGVTASNRTAQSPD
jgi:hypothetical protein